jgi:hypothetical protein
MTSAGDRLEKINSLKDEVRELHPLLRVLFPRLPSITAVEYRQGPREMGADFVLEKHDVTLLTTEYIGVIVKTGKIRQDHSEIERQIDECELERTFDSGKKKIHLSELWVVSNDTISQGAQDKINHKFKNKSIKFVPGEKLLDLINRFYEEYWTDVSVKIGEYFRSISTSARSTSMLSSEMGSVSGVSVERELIENFGAKEFRKGRNNKPKRFSVDSAISQGRYTLIEASMGSGKSTLLLGAAQQMAAPDRFNATGRLPIFSTVKDVVDRHGGNLNSLATSVFEDLDVDDAPCTIFLDGLDELKLDADEQIELLKKFKSSIADQENLSIVISSRPLAVEVDQVVSDEFNRFSIPPFTVKQVISLVDSICKSQGILIKLTKDLEKSNLFKVLPKTPISAILLAKLLQENIHEIPSTMTELYGKYMELVMGRWDMGKGLQSQTEYEVLQNVTVLLAEYVLDNSLDVFSVAEAREMFAAYIGSRNLKISPDETFHKLVSRSEVFNLSSDGGAMSFRHRTFAEFFYAYGMERRAPRALDVEALKHYWATVYFFYFGIKKDSTELVSQLVALNPESEDLRFGKMMVVPNMLLAAYLTPYDQITNAVSKYFDEVTELYLSIVSGQIPDSALIEFSSLDLCCIFTKITSSSLGYEFFLAALKECAEETYSSPTLDRSFGVTKLFFVNSALATLGYKHAYETMLADYGNEIPIQLRIGIAEHSAEVQLKAEVVSKYAKRLEKRIKTEHGMNKLVQGVLKPISSLLKSK